MSAAMDGLKIAEKVMNFTKMNETVYGISDVSVYTPMMQHYLSVKSEYRDCILFYRLGDFYEMFFDDAKVVSKELRAYAHR
jgi:hypothetical protein